MSCCNWIKNVSGSLTPIESSNLGLLWLERFQRTAESSLPSPHCPIFSISQDSDHLNQEIDHQYCDREKCKPVGFRFILRSGRGAHRSLLQDVTARVVETLTFLYTLLTGEHVWTGRRKTRHEINGYYIDLREYAQYPFQGRRHSLDRNSGRKTSKSYFSSFSSHSRVANAGISTPKPCSISSAWECPLELGS